MQNKKALLRAAKNAKRDGTFQIVKVNEFNPVAPKGFHLVSVSIISETTMTASYAKAKQN